MLYIYGFDVFCGVLHRQFYMRKSLVCDVIEPFRPIIDLQIRKANDGELIVNGSITTDKLSANTIEAISIAARDYTAYKNPANPTGARTVVSGGLTTIYDDNNRIRVRLGFW